MTTREKQYNSPLADYYAKGPVKLGFMTSHVWRTDPKRLAFRSHVINLLRNCFLDTTTLLKLDVEMGLAQSLCSKK